MARSLSPRRLLAGAGAVAALGGGALFSVTADAQQPATGVHVIAACAPAGTPPAGGVAVAVEAGRVEHLDLAADLARALGKSRDEVERALEQAERAVPKPDRSTVVATRPDGAGDGLQPVATRLGVSVDELTDAMRAAAPCPSTATAGAQPFAGTVAAIQFDPTRLFEAIAAHLGRGITGAQVREAFEASRPKDVEIESVAVVTPQGPYLEALARALGITVEQLEAALRQIAPRRP